MPDSLSAPPVRFDLALIGFGHVARRFVRLLLEQLGRLEQDVGVSWRIVGISTRRHGTAIAPDGLDAGEALALVEHGETVDRLHDQRAGPSLDGALPLIERLGSAATSDDASPPLVIIETTILDIQHGQPAIDHVRTALDVGAHVVSANKGPAAFAYRELAERAEWAGVSFLTEGAVLDGIPVFNLVRETLPAVQVVGFRGVVNSTTNHILTAMEDGQEPADALAAMQAAGIAEADASLDIDGWDAAAKAAVLINVLMQGHLTPHEIARTGIAHLSGDQVRGIRRRGRRLKLVASAHRLGDLSVGTVAPTELPDDDPLARLPGTANALILNTDVLGEVMIGELDSGLTHTAYALLSDLVTIRRRMSAARGGASHRTRRPPSRPRS